MKPWTTSISDNLELKVDWHGKVGLENKWLDNLMTLKPDNCTLPNAIPSATLPHSETTEEFEVQNSIKVKVNFYMDDTEIMETTSLLKKLTLYELSNLTRVWGKNSKGVLIFHVSNRKKAQQQM